MKEEQGKGRRCGKDERLSNQRFYKACGCVTICECGRLYKLRARDLTQTDACEEWGRG